MPAHEQIAERRLLGFVRLLRSENFTISLNEAKDSIRSLSRLPVPDRAVSRNILRALFCHSIDDWNNFDHLFQQYWLASENVTNHPDISNPSTGLMQRQQANTGFSGNSELLKTRYDANPAGGAGAGRQNTLSKTDFRFIANKRAMRKVEYLAEQLSRSIGQKIKRIYACKNTGQQLDIRRTLRANISTAPLLFKRCYKQATKKPPQLIIFHDVSHSMSWNNPLLFRFVRGLTQHFADCHVFAFHTELINVTDIYQLHSLNAMREKLEQNNRLLLGGTSIATSLHRYNQCYRAQMQKQNSIILILSDGFDTDSPQSLADALADIRPRAKKVFWLSPMLNNPAYTPDTNTMRHAAKYIDALLPCSSLDNLQKAIRYVSAAC